MHGGNHQGDLASRTITLEGNRFYLDVKENQRGRFIKIAEMSADGRKNQIMMSFSTANQFHQNLTKFMEFYRGLGEVDSYNLKQSKHVKVENKSFYFDMKSNHQGKYLSISEVRGNYRNSILVPESGWRNVRDVLDEFIKEN